MSGLSRLYAEVLWNQWMREKRERELLAEEIIKQNRRV